MRRRHYNYSTTPSRAALPEQMEKLRTAFANLHKAGFITKSNYLCCGSCASYAIGEQFGNAIKAGRRKLPVAAVYYNRQTGENAERTGNLWLAYGQLEHHEGEGETRRVVKSALDSETAGRLIVQALNAVGLQWWWDGDGATCICVNVGPDPSTYQREAQVKDLNERINAARRTFEDRMGAIEELLRKIRIRTEQQARVDYALQDRPDYLRTCLQAALRGCDEATELLVLLDPPKAPAPTPAPERCYTCGFEGSSTDDLTWVDGVLCCETCRSKVTVVADEPGDELEEDESNADDEADEDETPADPDKPTLQLVGRDGNAFAILGNAQRVARKAGWDKARIAAFMAEATSGDYDNVLGTCMKYFDVR